MPFNSASRIKICPFLSHTVFTTLKASVPQKPLAPPQELLFPCEKIRGPLKSSFHFCSSFDGECVSCKNAKPLLLMLLLRHSINFCHFSDAFAPLSLFEIKLQLSFMIEMAMKEIDQ